MELKKATRKKVKLRLGLSAVAGGGKTYSALILAYGLCGDWSKIAVIDTENNSASLYSHLGDFLTIELQPDYTPERYIQAIRVCEDAGIEVIIIDSITHEWDGKGGCLEIMDKLGGKYQDWAKVTPRHQSFIDAILQSKSHVITTVRRKQDYEMSKGSDGKVKVEKAGLKEVTREGFEYELTVNFNIDERHNATASKDRTGLFMDKPAFVITEATGKTIKDWCESGIDAEAEAKKQLSEIENKLKTCTTIDDLGLTFKSLSVEMQQKFAVFTGGLKKELVDKLTDAALKSIEKSKTIVALDKVKEGLPIIILESQSFIDAEGKRRELILAQKA